MGWWVQRNTKMEEKLEELERPKNRKPTKLVKKKKKGKNEGLGNSKLGISKKNFKTNQCLQRKGR